VYTNVPSSLPLFIPPWSLATAPQPSTPPPPTAFRPPPPPPYAHFSCYLMHWDRITPYKVFLFRSRKSLCPPQIICRRLHNPSSPCHFSFFGHFPGIYPTFMIVYVCCKSEEPDAFSYPSFSLTSPFSLYIPPAPRDYPSS